MPSMFQRKLWSMWKHFWGPFVTEATRGEKYGVVINGDVVEGVHHRSTTQISQNLEDQAEIAYRVLKPIADKAKGRFWMIRGTEAHVGPSGVEEERLAKRLGAVQAPPDEGGQYARYELWKMVGPRLVHLLHHVGTTGSQAYEATAVHKELVESFAEAARWGRRPPDVIVRSHRHRHLETTIATGNANDTARATAVVTPAWQGKTPFAWRIPGARLSTPQFGGIVIRYAHGELFIRSRVWTVERSSTE